jgi:Flp pilus assembly protein CpaB
MRARRTGYMIVFLIAGLVAAGIYYVAQPRAEIVRARMDIAVLTPITADMVELVRLAPADAPPNAARSMSDVIGRYASVPILAGQDVDARILEASPGQRAFGFGAPVGPGQVAFALPVEPGQAVGAALAPGARIDVVAVPNALKTQTGSAAGSDAPEPVMLGRGLTVLALRTTDGQPLIDPERGSGGTRSLVAPKLGSVVVAIPADQVADFAAAALSSNFYLALSPQGPSSATP